MERSLDFFIEEQNIVRFTDRLKTECDPLKRKVLLELTAGEEAKRANNIRSKEK
jgi:hypothetical protein